MIHYYLSSLCVLYLAEKQHPLSLSSRCRASPSDDPMYLTAFTVVLWYDMSGPSAVGLKYNFLKCRGFEFNGAALYNNARRLQTNEWFYRTSIGGDPSGGSSCHSPDPGVPPLGAVKTHTPSDL